MHLNTLFKKTNKQKKNKQILIEFSGKIIKTKRKYL